MENNCEKKFIPLIKQNITSSIQEKTNSKLKLFLITGVSLILVTISCIYIKSPKYRVLCGLTAPTSCIEYICNGILLPYLDSPECYFGTLQPIYPDTPALLVQSHEVTDWKTYRNKDFDIEVKYPEAWIIHTAVDNVTGKITSFSISEPNGTDELNSANFFESNQNPSVKQKRANSVNFLLQPNANPEGFPIGKWYDLELSKNKVLPLNYSTSEIEVSGEKAVQRRYSGSLGDYYDVFIPVNNKDILLISHISQIEISPEVSRIFSNIKLHPDAFGIISFTKDYTNSWPLEWRITLSPESVQHNSFKIISKLKSTKPVGIESTPGFNEYLLYDELVDANEIQVKPNSSVDMKFRLADKIVSNTTVLGDYPHMSISAGFSRLTNILPYGTSFPIYMLGNKVVKSDFMESGDFTGSKILIAIIETKDEKNSYTYEIYLEKYFLK